MKTRRILLCSVLVTWAALGDCQDPWKKDCNRMKAIKGPVRNAGCQGCEFVDHAYLHGFCGGELTNFVADAQVRLMGSCDISEACSRAGTPTKPQNDTFDFIVVGAGVAGSVLARRLSDKKYSVLLLEAGPEEPTIASVPGFAFHSIGSDVDWQYKTQGQPNPTFCRDKGGECYWPRGKMVSGTGGMNGMMYIRGHPSIYDQWAAEGNPGWCYNEVKKYFERAENRLHKMSRNNRDRNRFNNGGNIEDHPLILGQFPHRPAFADDILQAARDLHYKTEGIVPGVEPGVVIPEFTTKDGMRNSPAKAYLRPKSNQKNLHVLTGVHVSKVLTAEYSPGKSMAYGVEVINQSGQRSIFTVYKEVILSAGAIGSPQILLLSGIGPKKDLKKLNIPVIQDLPVGRNLQNHVSIGIGMTIEADNHDPLTADSLETFMFNKTGPLASTGLSQVTAFFKSPYSENGVPDIQSFFDGFPLGCPKTGLGDDCIDKKDAKCQARHHITARPTVAVTRSRGYLELKSKNPLDHPKIYPNYFGNYRDMAILIDGIHKILDFANTPTMRRRKMKIDDKRHHSCSTHKFGTNEYWECFIRADTGPENHQVGTCKMGPAGNPESVVNHELKVHGVHNLRVADASIFPVITNANTMSPTIMVAEKAADMISNDWAKITGCIHGSTNRPKQQNPEFQNRFSHGGNHKTFFPHGHPQETHGWRNFGFPQKPQTSFGPANTPLEFSRWNFGEFKFPTKFPNENSNPDPFFDFWKEK